jgi:hypothetical protein
MEMSRGPIAALALILALSVAPGLARADGDGEGDFDRLDRADELTAQAMAAADAGDWVTAKQLAETVLTLDDSFATAQVRLVVVRALEREGLYDAALYEVRQYLALEIDDAQRVEGQEFERRIEAKQAGTWRAPRRPGALRSQAPGIAMVIGGAVPIVVGASFVGNDIHWQSQGVQSGTWAAIGTPLIVVGATLDIIGAILIARPPKPRPSGSATLQGRPRPSLGLSVGRTADDGWRFTLVGRW